MKQTLFLLTFIASKLLLGQQTLSVNKVTGDQSVFSGIVSTTGKNLSYDEIQGSPYLDKNFYQARVATDYEEVPVRYNSYKDEIEFQKDGKAQVLPKDEKFSKIEIKSPIQTFILLKGQDDIAGYFIELVNGKNSLYKKVKTIFRDAVPAANSYASDKPAQFKIQDPVYYIKIENSFIKKPKNQKEILEQFPNRKEEINTFFKSNKIKFDKDEDLIKLVTFLNQN
ncbi:hypothetical protein ASG22_14460 [Chryseobacterium sp. Leaf405]|uniref:hypothetical protein n=1 Tax=Chryseobacterium sp. Leaf405 TaxID=1736367 RepID=UPI0006F37C65|nr:hypothetical protein [Chryseobacterium sp. Leaf405]KQT22946.1 hypothetical protein ASG22_14460 [Chryseobacterium sp. Leaf405]